MTQKVLEVEQLKKEVDDLEMKFAMCKKASLKLPILDQIIVASDRYEAANEQLQSQ